MAVVPPDRFERLFRDLSAAERSRFVADLWAARGWETNVDGEFVVATREGDERRILVTDPGRFGTPAVEGADVLVTARDRDAVRDAATAAGVEYLPPDELREMLLYALDREAAAALFAATFDRPLDGVETPPTLRERVQTVGTVLGERVRERTGGSGGVVAVLLVLLLVGVAVAGPALTPAEPTTTVGNETFTPGEVGAVGAATDTTESATPESTMPSGLDENSVTDLQALVDAHVGGVRNHPRTLSVSAAGPPNATHMRGAYAWNYTARIESPRMYRFDGEFRFPASRFPPENGTDADMARVSLYTRGDTKYRRQIDPTGTTYQRYATDATGDASGYTLDVSQYLLTYLDGERSTVECARLLTSGECLAYRVVVTGAPESLSDAREYRAVAVVEDEGVVSSLRVNYTLPDADGDGQREAVRFTVSYDFSAVDVTEPDWLPAAKNATEE